VSFYFKRRGAFDVSFSRGLDAAPRSIPEPLLGPGILEAEDPPIRLAWISCANPVDMLPDSNAVARALESRELTVVVDAFMTDTARVADLVLPTTTMLEEEDLVGAYGHHYLGNVRPVVEPPAGVKSDYRIVQALAERVGLADEFSGTEQDWKRRMLTPVADQGASMEALQQGAVRNPRAPHVLFADRSFPTATGRVELIREIAVEPAQPTAERPLLLMATSTEKAQSSQWPASKQEGPARVTLHPSAAAGFREGDRATLESETGALQVVLHIDARQRRDVALMDKGGWLRRGRAANALIEARATDAGGGAVYYDTPVRLLPAR
jgi:anaerobic selenocysteine-containing dehydrogenase